MIDTTFLRSFLSVFVLPNLPPGEVLTETPSKESSSNLVVKTKKSTVEKSVRYNRKVMKK